MNLRVGSAVDSSSVTTARNDPRGRTTATSLSGAYDLVWVWYLLTVVAATAVFAVDAPDGSPWRYIALHLGLVAVGGALRWWLRGANPWAQRATRAAFAIAAIPAVFLALGLVLPAAHPEPYEWLWIRLDKQLTGVDPTVALTSLAEPWFVELLQWIYASFYLIPVITVAVSGLRRGGRAFEYALLTVTTGFLLSYLGYFLAPTLPPYRFLPHERALEGVWLANELRDVLDRAELHRWDCFPSGHTMLSLVCLVLAWRYVRGLFWALAPVVGLLVASTVVLRYHYVVDVLAGAALVAPTFWLVSRLGAARERTADSGHG